MTNGKPIRVAHLIGSTGLYGAERWILAQMRYLDQDRVQSAIINLVDKPGDNSEIVSEARKRGHTAIDFNTGGRFNPLAPFRLARYLRKEGYTRLHSHGYKSDIMALITGKMLGIKAISTPHGWSKEKNKKLFVYEKLGKRFLKFFDRICPLSDDLYNGLLNAGIRRSKISLIINGVDFQEIDDAQINARVNGKKRIGFIGQFIERKRVRDLLEAFSLLNRTDCELFLIGEGPYRKSIIKQIESMNLTSSVYCLGFTSTRLEYLKGFDLFVLPSLLEGIPRCIMEAHLARVPVVGTEIEGIKELVKHEKTGLLVPPGNPAMLATAMNRLLDSPELAARYSESGRKLVGKHYSAEKMAKQYEDLYLSL